MPDETTWRMYLESALQHIPGRLGPGLTASELLRVELALGVPLPLEIWVWLSLGVPEGENLATTYDAVGAKKVFQPVWYDWRNPEVAVAQWRAAVLHGLLFDITHNAFWESDWGPKPEQVEEQKSQAIEAFSKVPPLVPLHSHRGLAASPVPDADGAGNPVFSVHQTDVVYYGYDLAGWLHKEFGAPLPEWAATTPRWVSFWSPLTGHLTPEPAPRQSRSE